jgi:phosphoglycolate phosphatase
MPLLRIADTVKDIDLIVFDKDGTLVDFDLLWAGKLITAVNAVLAAIPPSLNLKQSLFSTLGIDPLQMKVIPESPLAVSSLAKLGMACSIVLYQNGVKWHDAERITRDIFMPAIEALPTAQDIKAIGDVNGLFARLVQAGFKLAIFTSDDRNATEASLPLLGIQHMVEAMVCGNDAIANKPSGDGLLHLARHFNVHPERILMVGDSVTDMKAAQHAGVGWKVGVLSGTGTAADLVQIADVVVVDINEIGIIED